jgi:predicted glycosyltransferase
MRLLTYSQDGLGLGHFRRTMNIAQAVLARAPEGNVLTLADAAATCLPAPISGMDYVKLPTIVKVGRVSSRGKSWEPSTLRFETDAVIRLRRALMLAAFEEFKPTAVLVDHMPVGALGELKPILEYASQMRDRPRLMLGIRDILDAPDVIRRAWTESEAYAYLGAYDGVLVYGCRDIYDAEEKYGLSAHAREVVYCNYVVASGPKPVKKAVSLNGSPPSPSVLVMGGGGADVFPLAQTFLSALPAVRCDIDATAVILTGPNMPADQRARLLAQSDGYPVHVQTASNDVGSILEDASVVVTMGGYNSLCEILVYRKKALVVPRSGPSAEQRIRSQLLCERNLVRLIDPDDLCPKRMAEGLIRLLKEDGIPDTTHIPALDGAERAADMLLNGTHATASSRA